MKNLFDAIPEKLHAEIFDTLLESDSVKIERIISKGHKSPDAGWYDQDKHEWVMIVKGEAIMQFHDDSTVSMKAGDYINIPAHTKHRVKWTDPDMETLWLAVHY